MYVYLCAIRILCYRHFYLPQLFFKRETVDLPAALIAWRKKSSQVFIMLIIHSNQAETARGPSSTTARNEHSKQMLSSRWFKCGAFKLKEMSLRTLKVNSKWRCRRWTAHESTNILKCKMSMFSQSGLMTLNVLNMSKWSVRVGSLEELLVGEKGSSKC